MGDSAALPRIRELFEAGDPRFLDELFAFQAPEDLAAIAEGWAGDARPFAREALLRYIDDGCTRPGHRPLVDALFQRLSGVGDDEAVGHFLVAFDAPAHQEASENAALEYFRAIGASDPARYGRAMRAALVLYSDEAFPSPERVLSARGLTAALYWGAPALTRVPGGVRASLWRVLSDIEPAPLYPDAWLGVFDDLLAMLVKARSGVVRDFAVAVLRREYAAQLAALPARRLVPLFRSPHEAERALGASLLPDAPGIAELAPSEWLDLFGVEDPAAAAAVSALASQHASARAFALEQCVAIAGSQSPAIAALGLRWAQTKPLQNSAAIGALIGLSRAPVPSVRESAMKWLTLVLEKSPHSRPEHLRDLLSAPHGDIRKEALGVMAKTLRFKDSVELWAALIDSPHEDARTFVVRYLSAREPTLPPDSLRRAWASALVAIHRNKRAVADVLRDVSERAARCPGEAELWAPLVGVALQGAPEPGRSEALAALCREASRSPELRAALARRLPEIEFATDTSGR